MRGLVRLIIGLIFIAVAIAAGVFVVKGGAYARQLAVRFFQPKPVQIQRVEVVKEVPTTETEIKEVDTSQITISFVGDIAPSEKETKSEEMESPFSAVSSFLLESDITVGNLEGVITDADISFSDKCQKIKKNCYILRGSTLFADTLKKSGFDVVNQANNHALDFGEMGQKETEKTLADFSIATTGVGAKVATLERKGAKIAFLGFSPFKNTNSMYDEVAVTTQIEKAKKDHTLVVVLFHAGAEGVKAATTPAGEELYVGEKRGDVQKFARIAIDAGADAVVGSGPHVLRGGAWYRGKPVLYSLGNFLAEDTLNTQGLLGQSGIATLTFGKDGFVQAGKFDSVSIGETGTPKIDESKSGLLALNALSEKDFGNARVRFGTEGALIIPENLKDAFAVPSKDEEEARLKLRLSGKNDPIELLFLGDMMFGRGVKKSLDKNFKGNYAELFKNIPDIQTASIAFANLEGPISDKGIDQKNKYSFRFEPRVAEHIRDAGFDVVSIANNHMGDWTRTAYKDTLSYLKLASVGFAGGGETRAHAVRPTIVERSGVRFGYLAFTDVRPENLVATDTEAGLLSTKDPKFSEVIANAKKEVDFLVVSVHWGVEYQTKNNQNQKTIAEKAIDAGADMIVGHHPHVAQNIATYKDKLIFYSLGNFIFDQYFSEKTMEGMLAKVYVSPLTLKAVSYDTYTVQLDKNFIPQAPVLNE